MVSRAYTQRIPQIPYFLAVEGELRRIRLPRRWVNKCVEAERVESKLARYVELINAGDVSASNSAGADACSERRVAPRLDTDQDTKKEH
jgi:hypothetical protein